MDDGPVTMPAEALAPDGAPTLAELLVAGDGESVLLDGRVPLPDDHDAGERWRINTDGDAEWALAMLADLQVQVDAVVAHAEKQQRLAQAWADRVLNQRRSFPRPEGGVGSGPSVLEARRFFQAHLEWYARSQRADHDRKTVDLIGGKIATRTTGGQVEIVDDDALLAWAREHCPGVVRTRDDVLVSTLRQWVAAVTTDDKGVTIVDPESGEVVYTGDIPPGVAVGDEGVSVTITPRPRQLGDTVKVVNGAGDTVGEIPA